MTNRRFDFIGTILSRTSQGERPVPANNQEDLEVAATGRAPVGVTELGPVTQRAPRASSVRPTRPGTVTSAKSAGGAPDSVPARPRPARHPHGADSKTSQGQVVSDGVEAAHIAGVLGELVTPRLRRRRTGASYHASKAATPPGPRSRSRSGCTPARPRSSTDGLVEQTGADFRTQLITAALRYHLG
jgi:hypothetical protein